MADYMTEAVEAAAEYMCARLIGCTPADPPCEGCRSDAEAVVRAAAPIIERAVRDQIVHDLRAKFGVTNRAADWIARGTA